MSDTCPMRWGEDKSEPCGAPSVGVATYDPKTIPNAWGGRQGVDAQRMPCCARHAGQIQSQADLITAGWSFEPYPAEPARYRPEDVDVLVGGKRIEPAKVEGWPMFEATSDKPGTALRAWHGVADGRPGFVFLATIQDKGKAADQGAVAIVDPAQAEALARWILARVAEDRARPSGPDNSVAEE